MSILMKELASLQHLQTLHLLDSKVTESGKNNKLRALCRAARFTDASAFGGGGGDAEEKGRVPMALSDSPGGADAHDLMRFVDAPRQVYDQALAEIRAGRKQSHWMWYIFPQYVGLGFSSTSQLYAIKSLAEAEAYLQHPLLGPRLVACAEAALAVEGRSATEIFGSPDDQKLRSCATLFAAVSPLGSVFERLLDKYFQGERDERTLYLIAASQP